MSLKQSAREGTLHRTLSEEDDGECWRRERNCACLKVATGGDEIFFFPYQQFLHARVKRTNDSEALIITFGTHEIVISGRNLSEIANALREFEIESINPVPSRYSELTGGEGAWVTEVAVKPFD